MIVLLRSYIALRERDFGLNAHLSAYLVQNKGIAKSAISAILKHFKISKNEPREQPILYIEQERFSHMKINGFRDYAAVVLSLTSSKLHDHKQIVDTLIDRCEALAIPFGLLLEGDGSITANTDKDLLRSIAQRASLIVLNGPHGLKPLGPVALLVPAQPTVVDLRDAASKAFHIAKEEYFSHSSGYYGATTMPAYGAKLYLEAKFSSDTAPDIRESSSLMSFPKEPPYLPVCGSFRVNSMHAGESLRPFRRNKLLDLSVKGRIFDCPTSPQALYLNGQSLLGEAPHMRQLRSHFIDYSREHYNCHQFEDVVLTSSGTLSNWALVEFAKTVVRLNHRHAEHKMACSELAHPSIREHASLVFPIESGTFQLPKKAIITAIRRGQISCLALAAGQTNTGAVEDLAPELEDECLKAGVSVIVDGCGGAMIPLLPNKQPVFNGDNSLELTTVFSNLLNSPAVIGVSTDLGKALGPVGGISALFLNPNNKFSHRLFDIFRAVDSRIYAYIDSSIPAVYAESALKIFQNRGIAGLRYLAINAKRNANLIAETLNMIGLKTWPVNINEVCIEVDSRKQLTLLVECFKQLGFFCSFVNGSNMFIAAQQTYALRIVVPAGTLPTCEELRLIIDRISAPFRPAPMLSGAGTATFHVAYENLRPLEAYYTSPVFADEQSSAPQRAAHPKTVEAFAVLGVLTEAQSSLMSSPTLRALVDESRAAAARSLALALKIFMETSGCQNRDSETLITITRALKETHDYCTSWRFLIAEWESTDGQAEYGFNELSSAATLLKQALRRPQKSPKLFSQALDQIIMVARDELSLKVWRHNLMPIPDLLDN